jgi:Rrf2 family transcriptional regulator, iron-sulfur cluster assembly transcription factor
MKLTRGGEYGIRGVLYLARQEHGSVSMLSSIAKAENAPPQFLAKIFQSLTKAGVVKSHRGAKGGFSLMRPASDVSVKDVIEAIEGPISLNRDKTCPADTIWERALAMMVDVLSRANFEDLAKTEQNQQTSRLEISLDIREHRAGRPSGDPAALRRPQPLPG